MFNSKWLWANLDKIKNSNKQKEYYLTDIVSVAIEQGEKIYSADIASEEVRGINSREDLAVAERILKH